VASDPTMTAGMTAGRYGKQLGEPGLYVRQCRSGSFANLIARRAQSPQLQAQVLREFGLHLPTKPAVASGGGLSFIWNGPDRWMVEAEKIDAGIESMLRPLERYAAICDQGDGYVRLDVYGPRVRDVLAKGLPIDLQPFSPGDVAMTAVNQMGVQIWQTSANPSYRLSVARGYLQSFRHWLGASSAEFGIAVL
jgi:methylglutamate dehydrogenase subunit D